MFNLGILSSSQHGPTLGAGVEFITSSTSIGTSGTEPAHNAGDLIILFAATGYGDAINNPSGYTQLDHHIQGSTWKLTTMLSYKVGTGTPVNNSMNWAGTVCYAVFRNASTTVQWLRTATAASLATSPAITPDNSNGLFLLLLGQHKDRGNPINPVSGLTTIWNVAGGSGSNREDNDAQYDTILTTSGLEIPSKTVSAASASRPFNAYSIIINPA